MECDDYLENRYRVRLYTMNTNNSWIDSGTGYVKVLKDVSDGFSANLIVSNESDDSVIIEVILDPDLIYEKQRQSLIVWTDDENTEYALSFQNSEGCDEVLEIINKVTVKRILNPDCITDEQDSSSKLPECTMDNLVEIETLFSDTLIKDKIASLISATYFRSLIEMYKKCDDLESTKHLHLLYNIFKTIIYFNRLSIFNLILCKENFIHVIGAFENNPNSSTSLDLRNYFLTKVNFKQCIKITSEELLSKIHKLHRMQYLYEIAAPVTNLFEEHSLSVLKNRISISKADIVSSLQKEPDFYDTLQNMLMEKKKVFNPEENNDEESVDKMNGSTNGNVPHDISLNEGDCEPLQNVIDRKYYLTFVQTLFEFSSYLIVFKRESLYCQMIEHGFFEAMEYNLRKPNTSKCDSIIIDILSQLTEYNTGYLKQYFIKQCSKTPESNLFQLLLFKIISDKDPGMSDALNIYHIFRTLLDPDATCRGPKSEKSDFLRIFFKNGLQVLNQPICSLQKDYVDNYINAQIVSIICELYIFCVETHPFETKVFIMDYNVIENLTHVFKSTFKFSKLSVIRLVKKIICRKDESFNSHLVKKNMIKCIFECFLENEHKNNLIDSTIIDLFEYLVTDNLYYLLTYIIDNHFTDSVLSLTYVSTFKRMEVAVKKYREIKEKGILDDTYESNTSGDVKSKSISMVDNVEDLWFDEEEVKDDHDSSSEDDFLFSKTKNECIDDFDENEFKPMKKKAELIDQDVLCSVRANKRIKINLGNSPHPFTANFKRLNNKNAQSEGKISLMSKISALVDYDEDSDEDKNPVKDNKNKSDEHTIPSAKRPRLTQ